MHWAARYVGTPYVRRGREIGALDCWGLVWAVYRNVLGIDIPSHGDIDANSLIAIARAVKDGEQSPLWRLVAPPAEFDVVVMRGLLRLDGKARHLQFHVGIMVDQRRVMHTEEATGAVIVPIERPDVVGRIKGFYRHADR